MTQSNLYCVYTITPGDTLGSIARRFGIQGKLEDSIAPHDLLIHSNNPVLADEGDILEIGQKIRIPTQNGVIHTVLSAQTLGDIADQYDVASSDILGVALNNISDANSIRIGQELIIPNPSRFTRPAPPVLPAAAAAAGPSVPGPTLPSIIRGGPSSDAGFIWPAGGRISSYFGPSHPLGIDIDLFANPNSPIAAAASGTVTVAGGNSCCSYGLYVVVEHGNGYRTLYAHLSKLSVSVGDRVSQGQVLGLGGRTGYATGNHLHFEVYRNGVIINPLGVLP